ncbi:hypothetical protein [Brevundimonas lenta]|uniref:Uncharacterized protein n=1 Tax=Brevundimonas lenta TaxID=424796 RepID=A0A7W6JBL1_9CAUL|nr:hypothetical protein [Brevundimonas lenta]MBB4082120.1 hypothetical protein [Brevundimonas lenta]
MFKKALIPALVLAAASVAVPAAAQSYGGHDRDGRDNRGGRYEQNYRNWQPISQRKYNLDRRIDVGLRNGQLSRREATRLKAELNQLVRLEYSYQRNGLTIRERQELDRRYDRLSNQVREERRDRDGRRY